MFNKTMAETGGIVFEGMGRPKEGVLSKLKRFFSRALYFEWSCRKANAQCRENFW